MDILHGEDEPWTQHMSLALSHISEVNDLHGRFEFLVTTRTSSNRTRSYIVALSGLSLKLSILMEPSLILFFFDLCQRSDEEEAPMPTCLYLLFVTQKWFTFNQCLLTFCISAHFFSIFSLTTKKKKKKKGSREMVQVRGSHFVRIARAEEI